jgi:hypothetical protein
MVVAHRVHVGARFVDFAVNHHLAIEPHPGWPNRLGVERHFQDVGWLDELGGAMARDEIAIRILRTAHADMPECINDAFIGKDAIGDRELMSQRSKGIGHVISPVIENELSG